MGEIGEVQALAASSIQGAFVLGRPVALTDMFPIALIVAGAVAVSRDGARRGKGGGYFDLEDALGREVGMRAHDISLNGFATQVTQLP